MDKKLHYRRRLIQLYSALLYNAHLKGFITGDIYTGPLKSVCVPGLNCYSCPGAVGACPLGALQNALASSGKRAPFFILGILLLSGLILGRTICGFLCPFGLLQELLHKIPVPKIRKSGFTRALSYTKYGILLVFVVYIPLRYAKVSLPVPAFCKYICPAGTLEGAVALLSNPANEAELSLLGLLFTRKFILLVLILFACMFLYRFFCRFLCPLGAIYGCLNAIAFTGLKTDLTRCTCCGLCCSKCEMDVHHVGDHECIQCGKCMEVCPAKAISWKGGKAYPRTPSLGKKQPTEKTRNFRKSIVWLSAALLLVFVLCLANIAPAASKNPPAAAEEQTDGVQTGKEIGMRCPDFSVPLYGTEGERFVLSEHIGKVTVINFWATWCTPCCTELPWFQKLADTYPDITVIALHSNFITEDIQAYLDGQSYTLPFGLDETGSVIQSLGGSTMLPMTVILDRQGRIVYNAVGSVTYDKLEDLVLPLR